jgi:hypothetical protein
MKKIVINEIEYNLKIGFGVMMEYEEKNEKQITKINTLKDISDLLYITLKYHNEHFTFSKREFIDDILDNNQWLIKELTDTLFTQNTEEEGKKK